MFLARAHQNAYMVSQLLTKRTQVDRHTVLSELGYDAVVIDVIGVPLEHENKWNYTKNNHNNRWAFT